MSVYDKEKIAENDLENIAQQESGTIDSVGKNKADEAINTEQQAINKGFYNPEADDSNEKINLSGRKKKAGIGAGVVAVLFGGGIGLFGMLAQPLQFLQMSSMLRNFHFSDGEDFSDSRMIRTARYIKYRSSGELERTRLGWLGNKYGDRLETRLNESGLTSTYDGPRSTFSGYIVDSEKAGSSGTLGDVENKTPAEIKASLSEKYGIDPSLIEIDSNNKILIKPEGFNDVRSRRLISAALQDAGFSKMGGSIRARIMGKRAGVTWNPIKILDRKISASVSERVATFKKARADRINNGADVNFNTNGEPDPATDPEGEPTNNPTNDGASDSLDNLKNGSGTPAENIKANIGKAAGGIAIIGIVCGIQALADGYDDVKHANVVLPLMRVGVEALAVGDQIVTGQNLDPVQIDAMTELMYDEDLQNSWRSAKSIQAEAGEDITGADIPDEAKISAEGNIFTKFLNSIPGLDIVCDFSNSTFGSIISFGLDVLTGPVSAVIGVVQERLLAGPLASGLINWLAGNPIDVEVAGANYGNYINYGARLAANDAAISSGGRKLEGTEVAELKSIRLQNEQADFSQKSLFAKIFDARDYRTPAGKFMASQAPNPAQNVARVATTIPKSAASIFSPIKSLISSKVSAETEYDYGFPKYGYSSTEISSAAIENPFQNDVDVANLLDAKSEEINKTTTLCYGINIVKKDFAGSPQLWVPESTGQVPKYKDILDKPECNDSSEEALKIRTWIHDSQLMAAYACFEDGANNICTEFGLAPDTQSGAGAGSGNTTGTGVANVNCEGYARLASAPAVLSGGFPTNTEITPYNQTVKDACNTVKQQCLAGVADTSKILCSALEFHDSWYGNTYTKTAGVLSTQYWYGITGIKAAAKDPSGWYSERTLGLNKTNLIDCSGLTAVAVYRAYGYSNTIGCSGFWGQSSNPSLFKNVSWEEIKPGDFLTYSKSCNSETGNGHVAIAASTVSADGSFVVFEQSSSGTMAHFKLSNRKTWGVGSGTPVFSGSLSRWIGPGAN